MKSLFRSKKSVRQVASEPLPDWDDTRWLSHLRSNAVGADHHCGIYVDMINRDRQEAAGHFKNEDHAGARSFAESALRNNRVVTALAALSPLCNTLYQRSEPLAGYTSLVQIPEPARSGIVTVVFAASRLQMSYLTETVNFLREQFGSVHIDQIQKAQGELYPLVNATVRDALSAVPATRAEVDAELASAVKQHFGLSVQPTVQRARTTALDSNEDSPATVPSRPAGPSPSRQDSEVRRAQTTPISALSSDNGAPVSPQLSQEGVHEPRRSSPQHEHVMKTPSPPRRSDANASGPIPRGRMYASYSSPPRYPGTQQGDYPVGVAERHGRPEGISHSGDASGMKRGRAMPLVPVVVDEAPTVGASLGFPTASSRNNAPVQEQEHPREIASPVEQDLRNKPDHLMVFKDSDELLLARYDHLREVISA